MELEGYYKNYQEDERLFKDHSHKLEYLTTIHYLDQLIRKGDKILEVGAGTGVYSFYYSNMNFDVTAIEPVSKNCLIMEEKCDYNKKIRIIQADGRNLSMFQYDEFDVVLCLGPLYHLSNEEDQIKCITECTRVLKDGGIIAFAYINEYMSFMTNVKRNKSYLTPDNRKNHLERGVEASGVFNFITPAKMEELIKPFPLTIINHMGTDGLAPLLNDTVNGLSKEEFDSWYETHLQTCERTDLLGASLHNLMICKKE